MREMFTFLIEELRLGGYRIGGGLFVALQREHVVRNRYIAGLCGVVLGFAGCFGEPRLEAPAVNVDAAAAAALAKYDTGGDGAIDGAELDKAPTLKNTLALVDTDKDGRLTAAEISSRLALYRDSKTAMMLLTAQVSLNGAPLPDATVTLVPESFMGDSFKAATGTTDSTGMCHLSMSEEEPGAQIGFYRIEVSKKNASGNEILPAKYNSQTLLGGVIGFDSPLLEEGGLPLRLSGK